MTEKQIKKRLELEMDKNAPKKTDINVMTCSIQSVLRACSTKVFAISISIYAIPNILFISANIPSIFAFNSVLLA